MKNWRYVLLLIIEAVLIILAIFVFKDCASGHKKTLTACSGDAPRSVECPAGQSGRDIQICKDGVWQDSFNDCKPDSCSQTVFDRDIAPVIDTFCVSCHPGFNTYDVAKGRIDQFITRSSAKDDDTIRMPKAPNDPLSQADKDKFSKWKADGLLATCPNDANTNPFLDLEYLEEAALKDINSLSSGSQRETRWLYVTHKSNEGASKSVLKQFEAAIQKGVNSISFGRNIVLAVPVDQFGTLFRFNLNDIKLTVAAWNLIEAADPIDLESDTNIGRLLKDLTDSKKPMMSIDAFLAATTKAQVYYAIRKIPSDIKVFEAQIGVNEQVQLDNSQALQIGTTKSVISLNKNRLIARFESNDGLAYRTFDINDVVSANKNIFISPLLKATLAINNFKFDASEIINSAPNGLHIYSLWNAAGVRQDAAPLNVVAHNVHPPADPTIKADASCFFCHSGGYIPAQDEVLTSIKENTTLSNADILLIKSLYHAPSFEADNAPYIEALAKMGILGSDADPISVSLFSLFERNLDLKAVGALYLLTEAELEECLVRAQLGQLLSGGTLTFSQLQPSLVALKRECNIGVQNL